MVEGPELRRIAVGVHDPAAFQDENAFFVSVVVDRSFAGRNPSHKLGDLLAPEVRIDQIAEQTVLAGANVFAQRLMHQQPRRLTGPRRQRTVDDVTVRVLGATRADQANCLRADVLYVVDRPRRNKNRSPGTERVFESIDTAFSFAAGDVEHLFGRRIDQRRRRSRSVAAYGLGDELCAAVLGNDGPGRPVAARGKLPVFGGIYPAAASKNFHARTMRSRLSSRAVSATLTSSRVLYTCNAKRTPSRRVETAIPRAVSLASIAAASVARSTTSGPTLDCGVLESMRKSRTPLRNASVNRSICEATCSIPMPDSRSIAGRAR